METQNNHADRGRRAPMFPDPFHIVFLCTISVIAVLLVADSFRNEAARDASIAEAQACHESGGNALYLDRKGREPAFYRDGSVACLPGSLQGEN